MKSELRKSPSTKRGSNAISSEEMNYNNVVWYYLVRISRIHVKASLFKNYFKFTPSGKVIEWPLREGGKLRKKAIENTCVLGEVPHGERFGEEPTTWWEVWWHERIEVRRRRMQGFREFSGEKCIANNFVIIAHVILICTELHCMMILMRCNVIFMLHDSYSPSYGCNLQERAAQSGSPAPPDMRRTQYMWRRKDRWEFKAAPLNKGGGGWVSSDVHQPSCREDLLQELSQNEYSGNLESQDNQRSAHQQ